MRKSAEPLQPFDPQQKKETYHRSRKEILGPHGGSSTSTLPHIEDKVMLEKPMEKVSTLKKLLRSCVELTEDRIVLSTLYDMI
jgi:hypothetical protein